MNVHNFGSNEELADGIERFLVFNPTEAKLLEEEGASDERADS